jgi:hypothetical protein
MKHALVIAGVLLCVPAHARAATHIWLSPVGLPNGTVDLGNLEESFESPGGSGEFSIWVRPEEGQALDVGVSMSLESSNPGVIDFTDFEVHNPTAVVSQPPPIESITAVRWERATHGNMLITPSLGKPWVNHDLSGAEDNRIAKIQGFSVRSLFNSSSGQYLYATGIGGDAAKEIDPLYDAAADAWLFATVQYQVIGPGSTNLFLQVGENGIVGKDLESNMVNVTFGDGGDPALNARDQRQIRSATPDGSITVHGEMLHGQSPDDPIMPASEGPDGELEFDVDLSNSPEGAWFDATPSSSLLVKTMDGESNITEVQLPNPGNSTEVDSMFEIWIGDTLVEAVDATIEQSFQFPTPVEAFVIRGIGQAAEAGNITETARSLFLSFDQANVNFQIREIPEPSALLLAAMGILGVIASGWRSHWIVSHGCCQRE